MDRADAGGWLQMTLASRLLLFFQATLALVLLGFSITLYYFAHSYLHRQLDDHLIATLNILASGAEFEEGGLEWEPQRRLMAFANNNEGPTLWLVNDDQGQKVAGSQQGDEGVFEEGQ